MGNFSGQAYGLTVLSPIKPGDEHVRAIEDYLERMPNGAASPLARIKTTHLARWVVMKSLPDQEPVFPSDVLQSKYLLFESNFDAGTWGGAALDRYVDALVDGMGPELDAIYRNCIGFPDIANRAQVRAYFAKCQIETTFFFADYASTPRGTVPSVLRALDVQQRFVDLVGRQQGQSASRIKALFDELMGAIDAEYGDRGYR